MSAQELNNTVLKNNANLKAYYRFESGNLTVDSSGNSKTLTNNNTATETTGKYGGGVAVNGTNQSLTIAEDFNIGATNWTISVWAKPSSSSQLGGVVAIGNGAFDGFSIYQANGGGSAGNKIDGHLHGITWVPTGVDWTGTDFDHVVMTRDTTTTRIYVNGIYRNSKTETPGAPNDVFEIGKMSTSYWGGSIDEVAVFNTALSADQIKELYEGRFIGEAWAQSGLVAGWHLNGGSTDFSGNNNHGTDTAITYSQANGKFGQGAGFNGSSSFIVVPASSVLDFTGNFSSSFWFYPATVTGVHVIAHRETYNTAGWNLYQDATAIVLNTDYAGGSNLTKSNAILTINTWHFVTMVKSSASVTFYLNGNPVGNATTGTHTTVASLSKTMQIGRDPTPTQYLSGNLEELLFFNRALTAQEIRRMYAWGTGKLQ